MFVKLDRVDLFYAKWRLAWDRWDPIIRLWPPPLPVTHTWNVLLNGAHCWLKPKWREKHVVLSKVIIPKHVAAVESWDSDTNGVLLNGVDCCQSIKLVNYFTIIDLNHQQWPFWFGTLHVTAMKLYYRYGNHFGNNGLYHLDHDNIAQPIPLII